jgi:hypothetical protein
MSGRPLAGQRAVESTFLPFMGWTALVNHETFHDVFEREREGEASGRTDGGGGG